MRLSEMHAAHRGSSVHCAIICTHDMDHGPRPIVQDGWGAQHARPHAMYPAHSVHVGADCTLAWGVGHGAWGTEPAGTLPRIQHICVGVGVGGRKAHPVSRCWPAAPGRSA